MARKCPHRPCNLCLIPLLASVGSLLLCYTDTAPTQIYTLSLHDALPISAGWSAATLCFGPLRRFPATPIRSEEHTSELQSLTNLVCRLLLEKKKGLPQKEDLPSGTRSAAIGGVTTIEEMPNTIPPVTSPT